ncbi:glycosyltransferase family 39 protein [Spirillospora sp. NPDC048911]|uniref:glycosyltransferase family 39 protein n=1 Tax=Spirillospora sp. NPDC048911 TaxID=3364527 RepID=UPI003720FCD8
MTRPPARLARLPLAVPAIALGTAALLLAFSPRYGYHRDELYFRLLGTRPAWGYFDTPPLTPLIARASTEVFGDGVTAIRIVPALLVAVTVVLAALIARELGGGRGAQILAAAGVATGTIVLIGGHSLVTLGVDLPFWMAAFLFALRAVRRPGGGRNWVWFGVTAGLATYNRLLIAMLVMALFAAFLVVGPRAVFRDRWLWIGGLVALALAAPNLVYQATHDWPQTQMASALREDEGGENRALFVPMQLVLLSLLLVPVQVAGFVRLWRSRDVRAFALAYPFAAVLTLASGGRPDYTAYLLILLFVAGCVPTAAWMSSRTRKALVGAAVAVGAASAMLTALPVLPESELDGSLTAATNEVVRESVGWPSFVRQVSGAAVRTPGAVIVTDNYGEAGALARWKDEYSLPPIYSRHNELWWWGGPPASTQTVTFVGFGEGLGRFFTRCDTVARISGMIGEEDGRAVVVCRGPLQPWPSFWRTIRSYS